MKQKLKPKRRKTLALWLFIGAFGLIGGLLYYEQIGVIYVLSTIGLVVLLLLVAFTDLEKTGSDSEIELPTEVVLEKSHNQKQPELSVKEKDLLIDTEKSAEIQSAGALR